MISTRRKKSIVLLVFLALTVPAFLVQAGERASYPCYRLTKEPVLDGDLKNDPAWENIPAATGFVKLGKYFLIASKQTSFKIGYTSKALYIGAECEEPEIKKVNAKFKDGEPLWKEDGVEIFLLPKGADNYYQFIVNAIGSRWNGKGKSKKPLWNWQVKTYQRKDYYSVEIKIAFEIFGRTPKNKETWIGNICRNIYTSGDMRSCSSWAHVEDGFHEPDSFGHIIFKDKSLSIKKAKRVENNLLLSVKKVVKEEIKEEIKKILESFSSCQHELSEGTKTPSLKKDAAAVLKSYEDIKAQFPSIKTLSMKEVKLLFEKSQELSQDVDRLKEKILLESFF